MTQTEHPVKQWMPEEQYLFLCGKALASVSSIFFPLTSSFAKKKKDEKSKITTTTTKNSNDKQTNIA